jgi:hypothetical protein
MQRQPIETQRFDGRLHPRRGCAVFRSTFTRADRQDDL